MNVLLVFLLCAQLCAGQWIKKTQYSTSDCTGVIADVTYSEPKGWGKQYQEECTWNERGYYTKFECPTVHHFSDDGCQIPLTDATGVVTLDIDTTCSASWSKLSCQTSSPAVIMTLMFYSDSACTQSQLWDNRFTQLQYGFDLLVGCFDLSSASGGSLTTTSEKRELKDGTFWWYKYDGVSDCSGTPVQTTSHSCGGCEAWSGFPPYYSRVSGLCEAAAAVIIP
eukprot:TRINITY_DN94982_c0_g1_i1.p1 TRINITY_DN94982_c0_g1~~TRINITY_DN94982_c0_g1_i1.p1  ORF type:complete len:224 (-),score=12.78 TRINITY_DN94982_c0_g1_i1:264-935(-)